MVVWRTVHSSDWLAELQLDAMHGATCDNERPEESVRISGDFQIYRSQSIGSFPCDITKLWKGGTSGKLEARK